MWDKKYITITVNPLLSYSKVSSKSYCQDYKFGILKTLYTCIFYCAVK